MDNERSYYENADLWGSERCDMADRERFATIIAKLPVDIRTLLDIGCGDGLFLKYANECRERDFERLCGTDRSSAALACVQGEKVQASVDALPFSGGEFDAVTCMEVLEHLPHTTFDRALNELSRVACRYILICVPFNENLRMSLTECEKCDCRFNANYHLRKFDDSTMQHLLDCKGFMCRELFYIHNRNIVPTEIEVVLRFLGGVKRMLLRQSGSPMPVHTVCPACGYSVTVGRDEPLRLTAPPSNTVGMTIRCLLRMRSSWRWIGALYERL